REAAGGPAGRGVSVTGPGNGARGAMDIPRPGRFLLRGGAPGCDCPVGAGPGSTPCVEGFPEAGKRAFRDRRAHPRHQRLVVPEVVQGAQDRPEHLVAAVEVAQVGAAVAVAAGVAAAALLDRPRVLLELRIADADGAGGGEIVAIARVACRHHAVE